MIYHVTTQSRWNELLSSHFFAPEMYATEKFIHCCEERQIEGVLSRYFKGAKNLLVLSVDDRKLKASLKYEPGTNNELFPHVYGEINKDAIVDVRPLHSPD